MPNGSHVRSIAPLSVIKSRAVTPLAIGAAAVPISNAPLGDHNRIDLQLVLRVVLNESVPSTRTVASRAGIMPST